jgi:hypothetical protein
MTQTRKRWIAAAIICAAAAANGRQSRAQSADSGYPGGVTNQYSAISPVGPLTGGITGAGGAPMMGTAMQNNMFSNPYAAPALYGAMTNLANPGTTSSSTTQTQTLGNLGLMMFMANSQAGNRGNSSATNPATNSSQPRPMTANSRANTKTRGRNSQPAGLAARYFNRTQHNMPYPRSFYNRQSRYYP